MKNIMKPFVSFGKGFMLALVALPALPFVFLNSFADVDVDTISQFLSQFLM